MTTFETNGMMIVNRIDGKLKEMGFNRVILAEALKINPQNNNS